MNYIKKYTLLLDRKQKHKFVIYSFYIVLGGLLELVSVSLIMPLIVALVNTSMLVELPILCNYADWFKEQDQNYLVIFFLLFFLLVVIFKNIFVYYSRKLRRNFVVEANYYATAKLFKTYLNCDYEHLLQRNSNEIVSNIVDTTNRSFILLQAIFNFMSELVVALFLLGIMVYINWQVTLGLGVTMVTFLWGYRRYSNEKLKAIGKESVAVYTQALDDVREAILGFKEIKLLNKEKVFYEQYYANHSRNVALENEKIFYDYLPIHITEICVFAAICIYIALAMLLDKNSVQLLSELSAVTMSSMRIIPSVNRMSLESNIISVCSPALDKVTGEVLKYWQATKDYNFEEVEKLPFAKDIVLENISYSYPNTHTNVLENLNLRITKGEKIGIVGVSGGGKTTLVDIILGYLQPVNGSVLVDGIDISEHKKQWMRNIGYIPQMIFMLNRSIRDNITFGSKEANERDIWKALEQAQLADYVRSLPKGLDSPIGERGIMLSGGQRQRLGIARALYYSSEVLVFDEATSALDKHTEEELMKEVYALQDNKTMIIIAHNTRTLKKCDVVYRLENKRLVEENTISGYQ